MNRKLPGEIRTATNPEGVRGCFSAADNRWRPSDFLRFKRSLDVSRFLQRCDLLGYDDFDSVAKPLGCVRVTSQVLCKARFKINS
jgi:hypothetical protein